MAAHTPNEPDSQRPPANADSSPRRARKRFAREIDCAEPTAGERKVSRAARGRGARSSDPQSDETKPRQR